MANLSVQSCRRSTVVPCTQSLERLWQNCRCHLSAFRLLVVVPYATIQAPSRVGLGTRCICSPKIVKKYFVLLSFSLHFTFDSLVIDLLLHADCRVMDSCKTAARSAYALSKKQPMTTNPDIRMLITILFNASRHNVDLKTSTRKYLHFRHLPMDWNSYLVTIEPM